MCEGKNHWYEPVGADCSADEIGALSGDEGAKSIAIRHPGAVIEVVALDEGIFVDIDSVDDLERARGRDSATPGHERGRAPFVDRKRTF